MEGAEKEQASLGFALFTPFRSWTSRQRERLSLLAAALSERELRQHEHLRYGYFVRLSPRHFRRIGVPTAGSLKHGALLFVRALDLEGRLHGVARAREALRVREAVEADAADS